MSGGASFATPRPTTPSSRRATRSRLYRGAARRRAEVAAKPTERALDEEELARRRALTSLSSATTTRLKSEGGASRESTPAGGAGRARPPKPLRASDERRRAWLKARGDCRAAVYALTRAQRPSARQLKRRLAGARRRRPRESPRQGWSSSGCVAVAAPRGAKAGLAETSDRRVDERLTSRARRRLSGRRLRRVERVAQEA